MEDRETAIADCRAVMEALTDCSHIDGEAEEVSNEMEVVAGDPEAGGRECHGSSTRRITEGNTWGM